METKLKGLFDRTVRIADERDGKIPLHSSERPTSPTTGSMIPDNHVYGELQYLRIMERILAYGNTRGDRTGTGTHSIFGPQMTFDISHGRIPLLTTKTVNIRPIIRELLWFLSGSTNNNDLDAKIWDRWATEDGDLGPIYGKQWRSWDDTRIIGIDEWGEGSWERRGYRYVNEYYDPSERGSKAIIRREIDQIADIIQQLTHNPDSRRMIITGWNPAVLPSDQTWAYTNDPDDDDWVEMAGGERAWLAWTWGHEGRHGNGEFDDDLLVRLGIPKYKQLRKVSPQENVAMGNAALPACHTMVQFYTRELSIESRVLLSMRAKHDVPYHDWMNEDMDEVVDPDNLHAVLDNFQVPRRALSSKLMQRSSDYVLGVPFNIASYAIFTQMIAQCVNMVPDSFIWTSGDTHIYSNQVEGALEQLARVPGTFPIMKLNPARNDIDDFVESDFELEDYDPQPPIDFGPVAV